MSDRRRIRELERDVDDLRRRVRELEERPIVYPAIILQPAPAAPPAYIPQIVPWEDVPHWRPHPFGEPWIVYADGHTLS